MHRTSSASRFSDEFYVSSPTPSLRQPTSAATGTAAIIGASLVSLLDADKNKLPTYNPDSHAAKKERCRIRSAENAVHLIPLLLVACAVTLWFFSSPVDVLDRTDPNVVRIKSSTSNGEAGSDSDSAGLLTSTKLGYLNPRKRLSQHKSTTLL